MSDQPQRTNTYTAAPDSDRYKQAVFDWLAAHAPLWNQITYRRRQQYFSDNGDVWNANYTDLYDEYAPILGKAACQQVARKNSEAWRSHFRLLDKYHNDADSTITEKPEPPGYWGNRNEGYELHGLVRNDLYSFEWDEHKSVLEFGVGDALEDRYNFDHNERVTLQVKGNPQWNGNDSRLELIYDEAANTLRVQHPVQIRPDKLHEQRLDAYTHTLTPENTSRAAALDVGANNTLALVTDHGKTSVYHARPEFERFQSLTKRIATLQSELPDDQYTSKQIQRLYDKRSRNRDHARDAAVKHAADWLLQHNVETVYIGDLTDVLEAHWSAEVNQKTHAFWSHRQLIERIRLTLEDIGITVNEVSEQDSSSECPDCRSSNVIRNGDSFRCHNCHLDAHSDVAGAWNILQNETGPMAQPAALGAGSPRDVPENSTKCDGAYWQWNGHDWIPTEWEQPRPFDQPSIGKPATSQPG